MRHQTFQDILEPCAFSQFSLLCQCCSRVTSCTNWIRSVYLAWKIFSTAPFGRAFFGNYKIIDALNGTEWNLHRLCKIFIIRSPGQSHIVLSIWTTFFLANDLRLRKDFMSELKNSFLQKTRQLYSNQIYKRPPDIRYTRAKPVTCRCRSCSHYWDYPPGTISYSQVSACTNVNSSGASDAEYLNIIGSNNSLSNVCTKL